jgi:hypothetical protein
MDQPILLTNNVSLLRRNTDEPIELDVYQDRAILSIKKIPVKKSPTHKINYRYIVRHKFIYNHTQQETTMGYRSLKRALNYAHDIFHVRNAYMLKHNYKLYN